MKRFIIILFTITFNFSFAQDPFTITEVVQAEGLTTDQLYKNAKDWLIRTFVDAKEVIQYENREEGEIQGKAVTKYNSPVLVGSIPVSGYISYLVIIKVKDGRYKYEFTNFLHSGTDGQYSTINFGLITTDIEAPKIKGQMKGWCQKQWDHMKKTSSVEVNNIVISLKEAMAQKPEAEDEW